MRAIASDLDGTLFGPDHQLTERLVASNGSLVHDPVTDITTDRFAIDPAHLSALFSSLDSGFDGLSYCWELAEGSAWEMNCNRCSPHRSRSAAPATPTT